MAIQDKMVTEVFQIKDFATYVVILGIILMFSFKNIVALTSMGIFIIYYKFQLAIS